MNVHQLSGNLVVGPLTVDSTNNEVTVGSGITLGNSGTITATNFSGNGSGLTQVNSDQGSWVNGASSNIHLAVSTDKVGIGVENPDYKLDVDGEIQVRGQGLIYYANETSDSTRSRFFLRLEKDLDASYPMLCNRTPNGNVVIATASSFGGGDVERMRFRGGDGTQDIEVTNANFTVSGTLSAGTIEGANISGTVGDSKGGVKAVYFENTEQTGSYTDKSGILAFDENFYSDTGYGTGTYDPDTTFVGGNGGGLLIKNEDGWGAIFTSQNTRWAKGYWNSLDVSGDVAVSRLTGPNGGTITMDIGRGNVYLENSTYDNASGTGITLRTSANPGATGSIFAVRSSGHAARLWVGQDVTAVASDSDFCAGYNASVTGSEGDRSLYNFIVKSNGRVGVGTSSPGAILEVMSSTEIPRLRGDAGRSLFMGSNYTHVNSNGFSETNNAYAWDGYPGVTRMNGNNGEYRIHGEGGSYTVLVRADGGFGTFTGSHDTFTPFSEDDVGKIVYSTGNYATEVKDGNVNGVIYDYLTIMDSCPVVKICATENDKRVIGVLSTRHRRTQIKEISKEEYELVTGDEKYTYEKKGGADVYIGEINTDEFSRGYYNAVGEGSIWVCNKNGNFENGDYITSSTVAGYGQKQNDDLLHNYTVAKITADCDFSEIWVTTKKHKKTREGYLFDENKEPVYENILDAEGNTRTHLKFKIRYLLSDGTQISEEQYTAKALANEEVYIAAFVGCTYHCG